ncbi:MAG: hypothetical protein WCH65_07160 [bacterium]
MIEKAEKLLKRYATRTYITPVKKNTILLFGEEISLEDFYQQYPQKQQPTSFQVSPATTKVLKSILEEYATPILDTYSKKIGIKYQKLSTRKTTSKR